VARGGFSPAIGSDGRCVEWQGVKKGRLMPSGYIQLMRSSALRPVTGDPVCMVVAGFIVAGDPMGAIGMICCYAWAEACGNKKCQ